MSHAKVPTMPFVLPLYQTLHEQLSACIDPPIGGPWFSPQICKAAKAALTKVQIYFKYAQENQYCLLATCM